MNYLRLIKNRFGFGSIFDYIAFKKNFKVEHPDYFDPDGLHVFCGVQGAGKTLCAVLFVKKLVAAYPNSMLVTNVDIAGLPDDYRIERYTGPDCLSEYSNGEKGVIFLIDEIQADFNSLESKGIDPSVVAEICQQRKQRKTIIGTAQVFSRISKALREQAKYVIMCDSFLGFLQRVTVCRGDSIILGDDGHMSGTKEFKSIFVRRPEWFDLYDTYAKILRLSTNSYDYQGGGRKK